MWSTSTPEEVSTFPDVYAQTSEKVEHLNFARYLPPLRRGQLNGHIFISTFRRRFILHGVGESEQLNNYSNVPRRFYPWRRGMFNNKILILSFPEVLSLDVKDNLMINIKKSK